MTQVFYTLDGLYQDRINSFVIIPEVGAGYFIYLAFGLVQQVKYIGAILVSIGNNFPAYTDKLPLNKFLKNDPRICPNFSRRYIRVGKFSYIIRTAYQVKLFFKAKLFHHG